MTAATATIRPRRGQAAGWRWRPRDLALAGLALLLFVAVLLIARRAAGSLTAPGGPWLPWLAAGGLSALAAAVRWLAETTNGRGAGQSMQDSPATGRNAVVRVGITVAIGLAGVALSWPGSSPAGFAAVWLTLIAAEGAAWWRRPRTNRRTWQAVKPANENRPAADDPTIRQHLVRRQAADGGETVTGWLHCDFAPGQRTAAVHVAFCPPLACVGKIEVRQLDGPPVRLRVVQALHYGAKIEARLETAATAASAVRIGLTAASTTNSAQPQPVAADPSR